MPVLERPASTDREDLEGRTRQWEGTAAEDGDGRDAPDVPSIPPGGGGGGRPRTGRNMPLGLAVALIVLIAVLLTYLGMLTQIWANVSGAQLPGA